MASLPQHPPEWRQTNGEQSSPAPSSHPDAPEDAARSINPGVSISPDIPQIPAAEQSKNSHGEAGTPTKEDAITTTPSANQAEPRHCWICLQDEGDDEAPDTREWRSPCPCNLQAHEECMLEWIADLEAPDTRKGRLPTKILCPQCKAEIKVARPLDVIVSSVALVNALGNFLILPTGISALFGCLFSGSMVYGVNALCLVFGTEEAHRMLVSGSQRNFTLLESFFGPHKSRWASLLTKLTMITDPFLPTTQSLRLLLGVPMIGPALVLSRTTLADHAFAVLPITVSVPCGRYPDANLLMLTTKFSSSHSASTTAT
jgi:hypothetical protein